jgi:hypothetical protein
MYSGQLAMTLPEAAEESIGKARESKPKRAVADAGFGFDSTAISISIR